MKMERSHCCFLIGVVLLNLTLTASCSKNKDLNDGGDQQTYYWSLDTLKIDISKGHYDARPRANGFLFGINTKGEPPDDLIFPLRPVAYRFNLKPANNVYERIKDWDIQKQIALTASYDYPPWKYKPRPGDNGDFDEWDSTVAAVVSHNLAIGWQGRSIEYDIWNEGDFQNYWDGSRRQLLEVWVKGAQIVRQMDPDALIAGPSFAHYDLQGITQFLNYAKQHGVLPDIVSWHENHPDPETIQPHIEEYKTSPGYNLVSRIQINEYGWHKEAFMPGALTHYIANLDRARIDAAMRGSWDGAWGDGTLSGLLTDDHKPTPAWWVHKYYADMTMKGNTMVAVHSDEKAIDGLLSFTKDAEIYLLIGNSGKAAKFTVLLKNYREAANAGSLKVSMKTLYNNRNALTDPDAGSVSFNEQGEDLMLEIKIPPQGCVFVTVHS